MKLTHYILGITIALYMMGVFVSGTFNTNDWGVSAKVIMTVIWAFAVLVCLSLKLTNNERNRNW